MRRPSAERGFILIVVLLVLVVATLLVVGAIAFTGTERAASVLQTRADRVESCTRAARNLFLSRINVLQGNVADVTIDEKVQVDPNDSNTNLVVKTGHFDTADTANPNVKLDTVIRMADNQMAGAARTVGDISNRLKAGGFMAGYYNITATCTDAESNGAQEVEFVVRLGL